MSALRIAGSGKSMLRTGPAIDLLVIGMAEVRSAPASNRKVVYSIIGENVWCSQWEGR